jgi:hypothetical protein
MSLHAVAVLIFDVQLLISHPALAVDSPCMCVLAKRLRILNKFLCALRPSLGMRFFLSVKFEFGGSNSSGCATTIRGFPRLAVAGPSRCTLARRVYDKCSVMFAVFDARKARACGQCTEHASHVRLMCGQQRLPKNRRLEWKTADASQRSVFC